jgi:undecaprenyl-diphosphatase
MPILTEVFGPGVVIILGIIVVYIAFKNKRFALLWAYVLSISSSVLLSVFIKNLIQRPRPLGGLVDESGTFSFPSNHSTIAAAACGFFILFIFRSDLSRNLKILIIILLSLIIVLTGYSRLYLGVHYFSDVIGGYLIGLICAFISIKIDRVAEGGKV